MTTPADPFSSPNAVPDGNAAAAPPLDPERSLWRVPATIWVWLLIFALVTLWDARGERRTVARPAETAEPVTSQTFESYVAAESSTRQAFGVRAAAASLGGASAAALGDKAFNEAIKAYREVLASGTPAPGAARRLLIVAHAAGRPLDSRLVDQTLPRALRAAGANAKEVQAETRLWRALYAAAAPKQAAKNGPSPRSRTPALASAAISGHAQRIRQMRLRFLENRALADLYAAAGDARQARALGDRFEQKALGFSTLSAGLLLFAIIAFLVGLVFLGIFAWTALGDKRWPRVGRVATQPQRLAWGSLLDAFVFYLAFYRGFGLLVGVALPLLVPDHARVGPSTLIGLNAALQFFSGFVAVAYLVNRTRASGAALTDVGLSTRGRLWGNVAYGVAGYLASLPLLIALGKVSELIFRHFPNTTPNPILPLLVSDNGGAGRLLIFTMVAVGAPFFEELFFRGAFFTGLRTRWGWGISAVVCALAFALVHPPVNWLPIFGLGYTLSAMREMRQSLIPCFVTHFLQNATVFVFLFLLFR